MDHNIGMHIFAPSFAVLLLLNAALLLVALPLALPYLRPQRVAPVHPPRPARGRSDFPL
jgi:hypothetical protein